MLDVARAAVLLVAVGYALRRRFVVGIVFGCAIACVLAWSFVATSRALREPTNPLATPFLGVFVPNAVIAVVAGLAAFLMWHQQASFPEYWSDHL